MLFVYPAIFHEEDSSYWVEFPDLEGCQSFGDSLNDTIINAEEALSGYLLTILESEVLPNPASDIKSIVLTDKNSFVSLISCKLDPSKDTKAVRKNVTIPAWLEQLAVKEKINFSQVLQEALLSKLQS